MILKLEGKKVKRYTSFVQRELINDLIDKIDQEVLVNGWIVTRRDHGKIVFLDIRDRSGILQVVANQEQIVQAQVGYVVEILGKVVKRPEKLINPKLATGAVELQAQKIQILAKSDIYPFDMGKPDLELELPTLLDHRSLTLRHPKIRSIFEVQEAVLEGFRQAAKSLDCTEIVVPTIAASSTEGGAEVFQVDYFDHKAFLTQSPQLYKQMLVPVFERVFTVTKAYRAESSVTTRHLTESTQMDCEFCFVNFSDLLDNLEFVAVSMLKNVEVKCGKILSEFQVPKIAFGKIPRLKLREAQEIIFQTTGRDNRNELDLTPSDEVDICKWALEKHNSDIVTITHFPTKKRAFYTMPDPEHPEYSLSYDVLFRGVEMSSGSQRINDYQQLVNVIKERGMNPENFYMYLMAFKYGMPPEGGFSFGLERMTKNVLQLENIRQASLFPRDMERVDVRLSTLK